MSAEHFILAELTDLNTLNSPLKTTQRIKYTCFSVSANFIILGATSGGLYVFQREPCKFLQLLPNKEGAVTHVSISPDEKLFGFSTVKGVVSILERNPGLGAHRIHSSNDYQLCEVTSLCWNSQSTELYVGDNAGKVSVIDVSVFLRRSVFTSSSFQLMQLDSAVIQMDYHSGLLLVSTLTRSYICDTIKEQYRQIGVKLREGEFGGCFFLAGNPEISAYYRCRDEIRARGFSSVSEGQVLEGYQGPQNLRIFCARPGARLWEVQVDGTVINTHQLKYALTTQPVQVIPLNEGMCSTNNVNSSDIGNHGLTCNFSKLYVLDKKYILTYNSENIYLLDAEKSGVLLWSNAYSGISSVLTFKNTVYIWTKVGKIHAVTLVPLENFLLNLYFRGQFVLCAELCEKYAKELTYLAPTSPKVQLLAGLKDKLDTKDASENFLSLIDTFTKCNSLEKSVQKLDSGIFVVGNKHYFLQEIYKDTEKTTQYNANKKKCYSLHASPEVSRKETLVNLAEQSISNSHSLPDLSNIINGSCKNIIKVYDRDSSLMNKKSAGADKSPSASTISLTPPETLQSLKELTYNVSSKFLEKWQVFEEKFKSFSDVCISAENVVSGLSIPPSVKKVTDNSSKNNDMLADHCPNFKSDIFNDIQIEITDSQKEEILNAIALICRLSSKLLMAQERNDDYYITILDWLILLFSKYLYNLQSNSLSLIENIISAENQSINFIYENEEVQFQEEVSDEVVQKFISFNMKETFPFHRYFSAKIIQRISEDILNILKCKYYTKWVQRLLPFVEVNISTINMFNKLYSEEDIKTDMILSRTLFLCSDLLDPNMVLSLLKTSGMSCYYFSFCMILDKCQDHGHTTPNTNNICSETAWPLPFTLNAIFIMLQMGQIETCCVMGKNVDLKDFYYLVLRLQMSLKEKCGLREKNSHCQYLFLTFFNNMLSTGHEQSLSITDKFIFENIVSAFKSVNKGTGDVCSCGFPVRVQPYANIHFDNIGTWLLNRFRNCDPDRVIELCNSVPIMWHQVLPQWFGKELSYLIPWCIILDSSLVFEQKLDRITEEVWEQIVKLIICRNSNKCLECGKKYCIKEDITYHNVTMSSIGTLMIKSIGSHKTLAILMKYTAWLKPGELDLRFYQSCVLTSIVDNYSHGLRKTVVDAVRAKSDRISSFSPEVAQVLTSSLKKDKCAQPIIDASPLHHWGVSVGGNCPCCSLALESKVLAGSGGLTSFQCGHSFHTVCLQQNPSHCCVICKHS